MLWSAPAASTEGRTPGEEQGWQRELTAVSQLAQTLRARCQSGTPCKVRLPMLVSLQQPPRCPSLSTEGPGLGSSPCFWVPGCRRGSVGSHRGRLVLHGGSSFLASQPMWQGQEYIPARTLPAPRQSQCGGEDPVAGIPQLVQINQHCIDVTAGTAMACGGE